jgi:hypothetical protein
LLNFCIIVQFHHAFPSLARQPCPAALPGSLALAALLGSLARQPYPAALPGSFARQFDQFRPYLMRALARCSVLHWQVTKLHAHAAVLTGLNLFLVQFHHAFIFCMRALLSSRQVKTCSVVLMYTYSAVYCKFFTQTRVRTEVIFSLVLFSVERGIQEQLHKVWCPGPPRLHTLPLGIKCCSHLISQR